MSTTTLTVLSLVEAVLLVLVLAVALIQIRVRLTRIAGRLAALAQTVSTISVHLGLIAPTAPKINAPLKDIVAALPRIAEMAETLTER
jgi:hypothetical protein